MKTLDKMGKTTQRMLRVHLLETTGVKWVMDMAGFQIGRKKDLTNIKPVNLPCSSC